MDVVTEADRATEALIRRRLAELRPDDSVLGEEEGQGAGDSRVRWVVDPIDGTVNFLYGIPQYAVSIAAEVDGEVVAGVVLNPATGVEWWAARGEGAFRDGVRLQVREAPPLAETLVLTGFGYDAGRRAVQGAAVARLLPHVRDIRRMGAAALDLCSVAEGAPTPTSRRASTRGTTPPAASSPPRPGHAWRRTPGWTALTPWWSPRPSGFDTLLDAVRAAGLVGE